MTLPAKVAPFRGHKKRREANYLFDPASVRGASDPPEDSTRLIWMFLSLIRRHYVDYAPYAKEFRRSEKTFQRDVAKLRAIGEKYRFTLSPQRHGRFDLEVLGDLRDSREKAAATAAETLQAVAEALGNIVADDISPYIDTSAAQIDPFIRIAAPRLVAQTTVAHAFRELRDAWAKRARVRFRYPAPDGKLEDRTVEPHLVTYHDGRYYLVAFDRRPRTNAWRQFALDRIIAPIRRAGTFEARPVPRHYRGQDAVGLFKSGAATEVIIELSPHVAEAIGARLWQSTQRFTSRTNGWATIAFDVFDIGEAVRWAFRFGSHARIVAPVAAVALARDTAREILLSYETTLEDSSRNSAASSRSA